MSNNSSLPVPRWWPSSPGAGSRPRPKEVLTSAMAAADLLAADLAAGSRVLVCGGPGVVESLTAGFEPVVDPPAAAVVVGFHRDFDFDGLERASRAVRDGARFVATNLDATYPVSGGLVPGVGFDRRRRGHRERVTPEVAGKPVGPAA